MRCSDRLGQPCPHGLPATTQTHPGLALHAAGLLLSQYSTYQASPTSWSFLCSSGFTLRSSGNNPVGCLYPASLNLSKSTYKLPPRSPTNTYSPRSISMLARCSFQSHTREEASQGGGISFGLWFQGLQPTVSWASLFGSMVR